MISGIVPFSEIIQSVKDETGIENIRPFYEKIRRLIFRGEREIGYGGSVVLIKKIYPKVPDQGACCNCGKYFKFPIDFIEFEGVGKECMPIPEFNYNITSDGIRFHKKQDKDIVLLYWGISVDEEGFPIVTRNHEEAVVAFIVWKLYSSKIFLGIGNMNAQKDYERSFIMALLEARGDDAFPTLEQWNALGQLSYTDRRILIDQPVHSYDYCVEYEDIICEEDIISTEKEVYHWQQDSLTDGVNEVIPLIDLDFLNTKSAHPFSTFEAGYTNVYDKIGVICFAITNTENVGYTFLDALNLDVTSIFDIHYFVDERIKLYVSKNKFSLSQITYKIIAF